MIDDRAKTSTKAIALTIVVIVCLILASVSMLLLSTDPSTTRDKDNDQEPTEYQPMSIFEEADDFVKESEGDLLMWSEMDGETEFMNAYYGYYGNSSQAYRDDDGELNYAAPSEDAEAGAGDKSAEREIEEADIVKIVGNTFYVLNTYRGLIIIDITDPDHPTIIGRQQMFGQPVDMYVVDTKAYVILSSFYYYGFRFLEGVGGTSIWNPYNWEGSQICIVDITDNTAPYIINKIELEGQVTDTRRVGDVIYAVSTEYDDYWYYLVDDIALEGDTGSGTEDEEYTGPSTFVISLNFADPDSIKVVQKVSFPGTSNEIHVTQNALYVAKPSYGDESTNWEPYTDVTYVDISDPRGIISVCDTFRAEGRLEDRYQMDHYDDTFRMVTHFWQGIGESKLWVYDVSNPDDINKMGELLVDDAGNLMATRFEKERAYTIHLPRSIDPLDTIDLSDPSNPELCDVLEMPGWVEHIEVRGFKLLALGVDDSEGPRKVAVSLFDVTDPYNTVLEDRVTIGEGYSWSGANWDPKALSVIDDQNLILVPFTSYEYDEFSGKDSTMNGVQIVEFDLDNNDLTARGVIENAADQVLRTRAYSDRILSTSNYFLQVIDARDSSNPIITAKLELCSDIKDLAVFGDHAVQFVDTWWDEDNRYKFRVVDADEPDSYPPVAEINVGNSDQCYMYKNDELIYIFESNYEWDYYGGGTSYDSSVKIYDFSEPLDPELRGEMDLPFYIGYYSHSPYAGFAPMEYYSWYYSSNELLQMDGDIFIYHPGTSYYYYDYYEEMDGGDGSGAPEYNEMVYIIDLSDPDYPQVASEYEFNADRVLDFKVRERMLYFTVIETVTDEEYGYGWTNARYYLGRIDLTDPSNPELLAFVNIPGTFVDASKDGLTIYTTSSWFESEGDYSVQVQTFNILSLSNDIATLQSAIQMEGTIRSVYIEDGIAYFTLTRTEYMGPDDVGTGTSGSGSTGEEPVGTGEKMQASDAAYYYEENIETHIFTVYDLTKPRIPKVLYELELCDYSYIAEVNAGYVILEFSWSNGLLVFDFSDITEPSALGFYPTRGYINSIFIHEPTATAYAVCGYYGVYMVELGTD